MSVRRLIAPTLLAAGALLAAAPACAERFRTFGDVEIHYNALRSDFVPADVATAHGIARSSRRGMLNVAVLAIADDGSREPLEATVEVDVRNLAGQKQTVRMRPVRETDALYYIGEFNIAGRDTYRFELEVRPAGHDALHTLDFSQLLVADD